MSSFSLIKDGSPSSPARNGMPLHVRPLSLSKDQIHHLKKDKYLSSLREVEEEKWLEVIVPLHSGERVTGGVRVVSSLDEAQSYLSKKRDRAFILTISSILVILITLTLLFGKFVGNPIQKLVEAMSRAEKGDLEVEVPIESRDELGELGKAFQPYAQDDSRDP